MNEGTRSGKSTIRLLGISAERPKNGLYLYLYQELQSTKKSSNKGGVIGFNQSLIQAYMHPVPTHSTKIFCIPLFKPVAKKPFVQRKNIAEGHMPPPRQITPMSKYLSSTICESNTVSSTNCTEYGLRSRYRGADKSLARPGRKQATATEDFDFHTSYL
jgi:hypothetical protein